MKVHCSVADSTVNALKAANGVMDGFSNIMSKIGDRCHGIGFLKISTVGPIPIESPSDCICGCSDLFRIFWDTVPEKKTMVDFKSKCKGSLVSLQVLPGINSRILGFSCCFGHFCCTTPHAKT